MEEGRFSEVGSSMNWVRCALLWLSKRPLFGKCWTSMLSRSGITLALVSAVTLHMVSR